MGLAREIATVLLEGVHGDRQRVTEAHMRMSSLPGQHACGILGAYISRELRAAPARWCPCGLRRAEGPPADHALGNRSSGQWEISGGRYVVANDISDLALRAGASHLPGPTT